MTHLTTQRAQQNRRRAAYRAKGLCPCGKALAQGRTRCQSCIDSARESAKKRMARLRPHWRALGLCVTCGMRHAMPGRVACGVCNERASSWRAA